MLARDEKQRTILWLAVPGAVALVVSGVFVGRTNVRPTAPSDPREVTPAANTPDDRRIAVLEREVRRLRAEVAAGAEERASEKTDMERAPGDGEPGAEPVPEIDPAEAEQAAARGRLEYLDRLAHRVEAEPRDARFGAQTESAILRILPEHLGSDVQVSDVACGSTICQAKLNHPGSARLSEERLTNLMLGRGSLGEMSVQLDVREDGATTFYFIRDDG